MTITTTKIQAYKVVVLIKFKTDNKYKSSATITLAAENVAERGDSKCYYITNQSQFVLREKSNKKAPKRSIQAKFKDNLSGRGTRTRTLGTWDWRPLLYQLSYTPKELFHFNIILTKSQQSIHKKIHKNTSEIVR